MKEIKTLFTNYEVAEERANKADEAWNNEPENEELEAEFDRAYEAEYNAFEKLVNAISKFTNNQIDTKTAGLMVRTKRNELKAIIEKI